MKIAYNEIGVYNLSVLKETKRWFKHGLISAEQSESIKAAYQTSLFNPNLMIRILLFVASALGLAGVTGILVLLSMDSSENIIPWLCIFYGLGSLFFLELVFIKGNHHYKSGVNEALLYHSLGFFLGGILALEINEHFIAVIGFIVFSIAAIRYLDLICTLCAIASLCGFIFFELNEAGGWFQALIPFAFILIFIPIYFFAKRARGKQALRLWYDNLLAVEAVSLLLVYAGGNYFVVRELSVEMMNLYLEEGQDIPFAIVFYILTAVTPIAYLYSGIKKKDKVLIRVSLLLLALSAFTFKYYFSLGHPEISLTIAGAVLLLITLWLLNYLKVMRNGYTRENIMSEKWGDANVEAFVISQTLGGNQMPDRIETGGGGQFGGGGSSESF
ncbi:MAG TPA: hypothetical protein VIM65_17305 [Cyclobacteriaceae bacterium]